MKGHTRAFIPYNKKYGNQEDRSINFFEKLNHIFFSPFDVKKINVYINLFIMDFFRANRDARNDFVFYIHSFVMFVP